MATAEEMAIRTTWLLSLEMEKAAERQRATGNEQCFFDINSLKISISKTIV